jgi:hypothetical protein
MKKFFSAMLAVLLIAAFMLPGHAYAADESFRLYYTFDKPSYEIGDTVTVQLHLDRTDGSDDYNLYAFEDQILFDKLNLTYIDSSKNSKNAASFIISQNSVYYNGKYDILRVNYNSLGAKVPRAASLVLAELKFTATNAVAAGELVSSNSSVHTYPTATAPLDVQNGSYTIKSKVPMYTVSFSGGANATGSAPETFLLKEAPEGYTFSLPENSYALNNAQFKGWSDGKSTYQPGASYRMGKANVTFTAQWNLKHHLTFTGGTGAAGEAPVMEDRFANDKIALPTQNTLASGELAFGGWKTGSRVYQPGDLFTMPDEDVVFAAQWKKPGESSDSGAGSWVSPYSDVRQGDWYYSAVAFADGKGYMGSVGGGRFSPNGLMTRAMMATILYRMAGSPRRHRRQSLYRRARRPVVHERRRLGRLHRSCQRLRRRALRPHEHAHARAADRRFVAQRRLPRAKERLRCLRLLRRRLARLLGRPGSRLGR